MSILERLQSERAEVVGYVDHLLGEVDAAGRDLSDTEKASLAKHRERINELDDQIQPLTDWAALRETSANVPYTAPAAARGPRSLAAGAAAPQYTSVGHAMVDILSAVVHPNRELAGIFGPRADAAAARLAAVRERERLERAQGGGGGAAAANQITSDTPGLLPQPIVGQVLNTIDANRPFISSLGPKALSGIPGTIFSRPRVTQHTLAGKQTAEKTALPTRQMTITSVDFNKETYGGSVNISRQDIDWTSPTAWDILVQDLADTYAVATEQAAAAAFAGTAAMGGPVTVPTNDLSGWGTALYEAASLVYGGCGRLPNRLWVSLDVWAAIGPIVDQARLVFPATAGPAGTSSLTSFSGNMFELDRVVVPSLPAQTAIVGRAEMAEFYEERIGLLSAVEPSILGVQVAYGGYTAFGVLEADGFATLEPPAVVP